MEVQINILELASALAERELLIQYHEMDQEQVRNKYPKGIYVETEHDTYYTEEAQEVFNELYDEFYQVIDLLKE
jgi:hypothetical protein